MTALVEERNRRCWRSGKQLPIKKRDPYHGSKGRNHDVDQLSLEGLKDIYDSEHQITEALPKMMDAATNGELKKRVQDTPRSDTGADHAAGKGL
jgi:hypothetical protein